MLVSLASLIITEHLAATTTAATTSATLPPPSTITTKSNQITFNLNYLLNKLSNILKL